MNHSRADFPDPPEQAAGEPIASDDADTEPLLRNMRLSEPSAELDRRVLRTLARPSPAERLRTACLLAAAILALAIIGTVPLLLHRQTGPHRTASSTQGVRTAAADPGRRLRIERDTACVGDGGIVGYAGSMPVRGYRYQSVRQIWYFDPVSHRRLSVTVPRDQLVLVAVHPF